MVTIINMTDHEVTALDRKSHDLESGEAFHRVLRTYPPSGEVLRMDEGWIQTGRSIPVGPYTGRVYYDKHIPVVRRNTGSLRVVNTATGEKTMFDPYTYKNEHGPCLFIVSSQVLMAFPAIGTLICPAQIVRKDGRVLGCLSFSTNSPPHLNEVELVEALRPFGGDYEHLS